MVLYLIKRILLIVPILLGITLISFVVINLAPGSPTDLQTMMNPEVGAAVREQLRAYYGLDKPLHIRYLIWLKRVAYLDFGKALDHRNVMDKIAERIPVTLAISGLSLLIILLVAVPIGVISAVREGSWLDRSITVVVFVGFAIPAFWLALLLMILFGVNLGWLPISGIHSLGYENLSTLNKLRDLASHLILPVFVSAFGGLAGFSRYMRANMLEVIRQDYIVTARAKGLTGRVVIYRHALRNALLPLITILGLSVPGLIGGSVIFETIFAIPGMGQLYWQSVMSRDYMVIMGGLVVSAVLTLLGNLLADISYALVDPRIRLE
ncbi:MAG: ABC transporter permease [Deltaproteobacteria bacterium]|nr:ABC transporter permease [Deltaproteobacteria bacterium]